MEHLENSLRDENFEVDEATHELMEKTYFGFMQVSMMYLKMDRKHRLLSVLQVLGFGGIMVFHWVISFNTIQTLVKINMTVSVCCLHVTVLSMLASIAVFNHQKCRKGIFLIHKTIAQGFYDYKEPVLEVEAELRTEMAIQRKRLVVVPLSAVLASGLIVSLVPIVDRYGTFDFDRIANLTSTNHPFAFAIYLFDVREGFMYYLTFILQISFSAATVAPIGNTGFAYIIVSQNLIFQLKILLVSLENIEKRALNLCSQLFGSRKKGISSDELYNDKEFAYCYDLCIRKNYEHHQILLSYFYNLQKVFSVIVFISFVVGSVVIAMSLISAGSVSVLPGTTIASAVLCFAEVGFMYLFSAFSQYITDLSLDLRFMMYSTKWYHCNERTKRSIAIFQAMTLRPMTLTAGTMIPANMNTFSNVMSSAYSYYNLVNAFNVDLTI